MISEPQSWRGLGCALKNWTRLAGRVAIAIGVTSVLVAGIYLMVRLILLLDL
jgi:hypothetical protein